MSKARGSSSSSTSSSAAVFHNLPDFPYTPAPVAPPRLSALRSGRHFRTTLISPSPRPGPPPPFPLPAPSDELEFVSAPASPAPSSSSSDCPPPLPSDRPNPPIRLSLPPETARLPSIPLDKAKQPSLPPAESSKRRSRSRSFLLARSFRSSKPSAPAPPPSRPDPHVEEQDRSNLTTRLRRTSSWRRLRRMGNRMSQPLRSIGARTAGRLGIVCFCENHSGSSSSSGSSCCNSGEDAPDFIRAVLENNVLLYDPASI